MKKKIAVGACILALFLVAGGLWYTRPRTFWEAAGLDPEAVTGVAGTVIPTAEPGRWKTAAPGKPSLMR